MKQCFYLYFITRPIVARRLEEPNTKREHYRRAYALSILPSRAELRNKRIRELLSPAAYDACLRIGRVVLTRASGDVSCTWIVIYLPRNGCVCPQNCITHTLVMEGKLRRILHRFEENPNSCMIRNLNFHGITNPLPQTGSRPDHVSLKIVESL